ncbi:MAG TPA: GNVR domain-containing protein, partial [Bacteroidota bacterium]|nr:GNVR domain-containing protein [Bacteroidota bacterium]
MLEFFEVIVVWRRFIVWFVIIVTFLVTLIAFLSPKWYKATASIFPAQQTNLFSGLEGISSLVNNFSSGSRLASLTGPSEAERYMGILQSENALMKVIDKFDLTKVYDITNYPREKTKEALLGNLRFDITDEGALTITVYDKDPNRAAEMANYFVEVLNDINSHLLAQNAKGNREFIEQRYNKNLDDIHQAEERLKDFQLKYGVIAMPEQIEASIKAGATVYAELANKEIQLGVLKRTLSDTHPSVVAAQAEVDAIKKKLGEMNMGDKSATDEMKILVPFRQTPQLAADYIRLYRDVEIQYKILQILTPLYEQAKVEEQRNTPSVVVLDKALVPERKAKPKVSLYALLSLVISTGVAICVVFVVIGTQR